MPTLLKSIAQNVPQNSKIVPNESTDRLSNIRVNSVVLWLLITIQHLFW
jgi:hypothetical protein